MTIFAAIFVLAACTQILYYLVVFSHLAWWKEPAEMAFEAVPFSVVICARNERRNLEKFLPRILEQQYPHFEVIVVDDRSIDNTQAVLGQLMQQYPRLRCIKLTGEKITEGKREALMRGIKEAQYEHILLTDADCVPESNQWIMLMASKFDNNTEIVLGYGAYEKGKGWLNKMVQYDTFLTALQYFSFALIGMPYMGVGRNLAYKKSVFTKYSDFGKQKTIGGDDDLLVNAAANGNNTAITFQNGAVTYSPAKTTWSDWTVQKWRHANAGHQYKGLHRLAIGGFMVSMVAFNLLIPAILLKQHESHLTITLLILKIVLQLVIYRKTMNKLRVKELWIWTPALDFCMSYFLASLGFLSLIKKNEWTK